MGPNFVPGTKKDLYVKVRLQTALLNVWSTWASKYEYGMVFPD